MRKHKLRNFRFKKMKYYWTTVKNLFKPLYTRRFFKRVTKIYQEILPTNAIVLEVGAYTGLYSDMFLHAKRVYLFEPIEELYIDLLKKYSENSNVFIYNLALSDVVGEKKLFIHNESDSMGTLSDEVFAKNEDDYDLSVVVKTTTFEDFFKENNIRIGEDFICIKLDLQGYEQIVLTKLPFMVDLLSFETHKVNLNYCKMCMDLLHNLCENLEYNVIMWHSPEGDGSFVFKDWVTSEEAYSYLDTFEKYWVVADVYVRKVKKNEK